MVIDTSALIAILLGEPEAETFAEAIAEDPKRLVSVFTLLETSIVIETKKGDTGGRELDLLIHRASMEIVAMDPGQIELARLAWRDFFNRLPCYLSLCLTGVLNRPLWLLS